MPRDASAVEAEIAALAAELVYYCAGCGRLITRSGWRLAMNGGHEHVVFNPAGLIFRILCFRQAPGVVAEGAASGEFTWFKGWDWRVARCGGCAAHLGWRYEGPSDPAIFFGLIQSMLTIGADRQE